jgi:hypothetical protein
LKVIVEEKDGFIFTNEKIKKDGKKITSLKQIHESGLQYKFHRQHRNHRQCADWW